MADEKSTSVQVDASIPLRAVADMPTPANPLTQYGDFLKLQSAVNQNKLFPGQLQQQQQSIQSNANALALQNRNAVYSHVSPAMADTDPTLDKVTTLIGVAAKNGFNVDPVIQDLHESFPVAGTAAERRQWIASRVGASLSPAEQVANATPRFVGTANVGSEIVPLNTSPALGQNPGQVVRGGAPLTTQTSPEFRATERDVPVKQADGTYLMQPQPRSARPGASGVDGSEPPRPGAIPGNGSYVPRGTGAATAPAPSVPASPAVSLPQGQSAGVDEDVRSFKKDQFAIPATKTGIVNLDTAREALALTHSGRSTETVHNFYSFLKSQGLTPEFKDNDITQYDIARKAMLSYASDKAKGSGTDLGLESQIHSNASMDIDTAAAMHVIKQNTGLRNQSIAQVMEAPNGGTGVGYGTHSQNFTTNTDPRGFAWDRYTPEERQQIVDQARKTKGGYEKLVKSVEMATRHHLVSIPNEQPATAAPPAVVQQPDVPH